MGGCGGKHRYKFHGYADIHTDSSFLFEPFMSKTEVFICAKCLHVRFGDERRYYNSGKRTIIRKKWCAGLLRGEK